VFQGTKQQARQRTWLRFYSARRFPFGDATKRLFRSGAAVCGGDFIGRDMRSTRCAPGENPLILESRLREIDCRPSVMTGGRRDDSMGALHSMPYLYTMSGFAVGLLVGMTGVGGGALMTPILILLFGIHPAAAVGTDLLHAAATKTAGSVVHGLKGTIDWTVVRRLAIGSVPTTLLTIAAMSAFDINGAAGRSLVNAVLTLALLVTAIALVFRGRIVARYADRLAGLAPNQVTGLTILVGAVLGTIVSLSSVGAGAIGVTCLLLLYPRLPAVKIVGSDIAHAVPLTLVAGIGHWLLGSIDFVVFGLLILGSVPGVLLGSYAAVRLPEPALRLVLAAVLLVVAAKLSIGLFTPPANLVAVETQGRH
jgi:uncharacterized membrane protein YfcA